MEQLSALLEKANNDSKKSLTKDEQKEYRLFLLDTLKSSGITDDNIYYIVSGLKYGTVNCFANWNRGFDSEKKVENLGKLTMSSNVKSQDNVVKLRLYLSLLISELNEKEINDGIVGELLHSLDEFSYKKDGTRLSDLGKIFKNCFMLEMRRDTTFPDLTKYNFSREYLVQLVLFFEEAINSLSPKGDEEIDKRNALRKWIQKEAEKASIEKNGSEQEKESIDGNSENLKGTQAVKKGTETEGVLAKKLIELAQSVDGIEKRYHESLEEIKQKDREISRIKTDRDKLESLCKAGNEENDELRKELLEVRKQLEECQKERKELEDRVSRQVSVIDVYDHDKANTKTEIQNQIAAALKKIFDDYKVAENMPMSIDLGENMRDSLDDVFRKLKKLGIDVEGR